jgi:hypothetical protein
MAAHILLKLGGKPFSRNRRATVRDNRRVNKMIPSSWHERREREIVRFIDERVGDYYRASNERLAEMTGLSFQDLQVVPVRPGKPASPWLNTSRSC